jgi:hypothetical protein
MAVRIAYGPPGAKGVTTIVGLGAEDVEPHPADKLLGRAGWIGIAIWAVGVVTNRSQIRGVGLGVAATGFGVKYLGNRELAQLPKTVTG